MSAALKAIPPIEPLAHSLEATVALPKPLIIAFIRKEVHAWRERMLEGESADRETIEADISKKLTAFSRSRLQPVINGTGVLIHTNLGRSPLGKSAASALESIATGYSNLEFNLIDGTRGKRAGYLETALACLVQSEAATAVNNCAAALVLILRHLCSPERNEVIVSRSELVEIGGGFRVPEILETSGAKLVEVGATNKTHLEDYARAITPRTALVLKVHRSNFYIEGFTAEPEMAEIAELCRAQQIPLVEDLGSGAIMDTDQLAPIDHEPTPQETLKNGADLICFSGDKLLGGPQSGIIAGRADLVAGVKKEPFFRAVRCDKLILTVLQECIDEYLRTQAKPTETDIPNIKALALSTEQLQQRAAHWIQSLYSCKAQCRVVESMATTGGGTMPRSQIPSLAIQIQAAEISTNQLAKQLRTGDPAVVGYIQDKQLHLDLRSIFDWQDPLVIQRIKDIL
ncbi:L-seryl-tRNA(Sec) selenium transferase [Rubritalea marina]|uniref:L-seryl-tRNA(Sec) selenium transferase n=1 Tax=Rubritalea marina TaxID=361055 RepID=UPI000372EF6C|nr:L-seryl-tRNA(Sec) selenium transferase [Rubritalea marina]